MHLQSWILTAAGVPAFTVALSLTPVPAFEHLPPLYEGQTVVSCVLLRIPPWRGQAPVSSSSISQIVTAGVIPAITASVIESSVCPPADVEETFRGTEDRHMARRPEVRGKCVLFGRPKDRFTCSAMRVGRQGTVPVSDPGVGLPGGSTQSENDDLLLRS